MPGKATCEPHAVGVPHDNEEPKEVINNASLTGHIVVCPYFTEEVYHMIRQHGSETHVVSTMTEPNHHGCGCEHLIDALIHDIQRTND